MKAFDWPELRKTNLSSHTTGSRAAAEGYSSQAERAGYEAGYTKGAAEAQRELERLQRELLIRAEELRDAVESLHAARVALESADAIGAVEAQQASVAMAYELCATILEREMQVDGAVLDTVTRAVALLPSRDASVVRVSPADYAKVAEYFVGGGVRVVTDDTVSPGGCIVEAGAARVDARWETALARVKDAIGVT